MSSRISAIEKSSPVDNTGSGFNRVDACMNQSNALPGQCMTSVKQGYMPPSRNSRGGRRSYYTSTTNGCVNPVTIEFCQAGTSQAAVSNKCVIGVESEGRPSGLPNMYAPSGNGARRENYSFTKKQMTTSTYSRP